MYLDFEVFAFSDHLLREMHRMFNNQNTPGTRGGPGSHDRDAGCKKKKKCQKISFFVKNKNTFFCIYLLVMPKYWGKQIFAHERLPKVGQMSKAKDGEKKKRKKIERW